MTIRIYSAVSVPLKVSLMVVSALLLLGMSVDVAAQQPTISVHDAVVTEGNSGTTQATFVVELSSPAPASPAVSFNYTTSDGGGTATATAGSDYQPTSGGPITFAAGEMQNVTLTDPL